MQKPDAIRLKHMLDAGGEIVTFVNGRSREDLDTDRMLVHSIVRCIEIIGEAASQVTAETRQEFSVIPWGNMIGMRNRLIHAYFEIDLDRVWDTVIDDLPPLLEELTRITEQHEI